MYMGFGMILAGFILLFNPVINVVDIIPDAIGFFLITAGLSKMSCFIEKLSVARDTFFKLAFVETAKIFAVAFIPYTSGSALVLMSFVFGVLELLLFIPAVNNLFEGISFAALWYNGTAVYAKKQIVQKKNNTSKVVRTRDLISTTKNYILFFYIFRVCATLLPELTELEMYDYLGEVKAIQRSLVSYKPFLYVVLCITTLILGSILIRRLCVYFGGICKDSAFITSLAEKYESEKKTRPTFFIARKMKTALFLFMLSVITSLIITVDGVNVLVGAVSSALLIASAVIILAYNKNAVCVIIAAVVRAVLSFVSFALQIGYFSEYSIEAIEWVSNAYDMYYKMALIAAFEYIIALAAMLLYISLLMKTIKTNLDMFGVQTDNVQYSKKNRDLETYNIVGGRLLMCLILAIINYIMSAAFLYVYAQTTLAFLIATVITLVWIAYTVSTVNTINRFVYDQELKIS